MSTASGELTNRTKHLDLGLESFTLMFCSSFQLHFFVACNFAFWSKVGCSAKYSVRFQLPVGGRGLARPRSAADAAVMPPQQRRTLRVIPLHVCGFEQISEPTLGEHWSGPLHCPLSIALQIVVEHVDGSHGLVSAVERRTREKSTSRPERRAIWRASG